MVGRIVQSQNLGSCQNATGSPNRKRRINNQQQLNRQEQESVEQQNNHNNIRRSPNRGQRLVNGQEEVLEEEQQQQQQQNNYTCDRGVDEIETEIRQNLLTIIKNHPSSKVSIALRELLEEVTQKKIVTVFLELSEKPEICVDYNIPLSELLEMYIACRETPILSEAGYMIFSASKIYSRRVDDIYDTILRISAGIEEDLRQMEEDQNQQEQQLPEQNRPTKRTSKRRLLKPNDFYEADMIPKKIKLAQETKITEKITNSSLIEPPAHFFKEWKKYKEWREIQKKKMKGNYQPLLIQCEDQYIHPEMWKNSNINEFDDDDLETKRSFRIFTNYIEHRYNMLTNDVNFLMHFKVKDFIDAEEDRIEEMNLLGLPSPPKRKWPPFCNNDIQIRNLIQENSNIEINNGDTINEDYMQNYIELENVVLEQDSFIENDKQKNKSSQRKNNISRNIDENDNESGVNDFDEFNNTENLPISPNNISNNTTNSNSLNENSTTLCNNETTTILDSANNSIGNENCSQTTAVNDTTLGLKQSEGEISSIQLSESIKQINGIPSHIINENTSTVHDFKLYMLRPCVVMVNLFPMLRNCSKTTGTSTISMSQQNNILVQNLLGIQSECLQTREDFQLPSEFLKPKLKKNIFRISEGQLLKRKIFELPQEYNIWKRDRCKRLNREVLERKYRLFKLNDNDFTGVPITPPSSPKHESDFLGFSMEEISSSQQEDVSLKCLTRILNSQQEKQQDQIVNDFSLSLNTINLRDSGIGLTDLELSQNENLTANNNENDNNNDGITDNDSFTAPNLNSTSFNITTKMSPSFSDSGIQSSCTVQNSTINLQNEIEDGFAMRASIQKWHQALKPVLAHARERHHFDIYNLGTEIINSFPQQETNNEHKQQNKNIMITLKDIMKEKDPSYISRYFLSTLLLANQGNIDIVVYNKNTTKPSALNEINLKLLSRERHNVAPEDDIGIHSTISKQQKQQQQQPPTSVPQTLKPTTKTKVSPTMTALKSRPISVFQSTPYLNGSIASSTPVSSSAFARQFPQQNGFCNVQVLNNVSITKCSSTTSSSTKILNNLVKEKITIATASKSIGTTLNQSTTMISNHQSSDFDYEYDDLHRPGPSGLHLQRLNKNNHPVLNYSDESSGCEEDTNFAELTKRFKPNNQWIDNEYESISELTSNFNGKHNNNEFQSQNTLFSSSLTSTAATTSSSTIITGSVETQIIENDLNNDGFTYPKKSKNLYSFVRKTRERSDDTDSGFHSQISSSSQKSIVF